MGLGLSVWIHDCGRADVFQAMLGISLYINNGAKGFGATLAISQSPPGIFSIAQPTIVIFGATPPWDHYATSIRETYVHKNEYKVLK